MLKGLSQLTRRVTEKIEHGISKGKEYCARAKEACGRVISDVRSQIAETIPSLSPLPRVSRRPRPLATAGLAVVGGVAVGGCSETVILPAPVDPACPHWHLDADGDGYGDVRGESIHSCDQPDPLDGVPYVDNGDDCDDTTPLAHPEGYPNCPSRAVWFWHADGILTDPDEVSRYVDALDTFGIDVVYVSAGSLFADEPVLDNPTPLADWNAALDARGIESHLLLSSRTWICNATSLGTQIDDFGWFNAGRFFRTEWFDGVAIDNEPWALDGTDGDCDFDWGEEDASTRRVMLNVFASNLVSARSWIDATLDIDLNLLDNQEAPTHLALSAALPWWADSFGDGGIWEDATARDQWYGSFVGALDWADVMAGFEVGEGTTVEQATVTLERSFGEIQAGLLPVRVAFDVTDEESWTPEAAVEAASLLEHSPVGGDIEGTAFNHLQAWVESLEAR